MKGRKSFSSWEADRIRSLLKTKAKASRQRQKGIRARIRSHGLYISDLRTGGAAFTHEDFDRRIASGQISVRDSWLTRLRDWFLGLFRRRSDKGQPR